MGNACVKGGTAPQPVASDRLKKYAPPPSSPRASSSAPSAPAAGGGDGKPPRPSSSKSKKRGGKINRSAAAVNEGPGGAEKRWDLHETEAGGQRSYRDLSPPSPTSSSDSLARRIATESPLATHTHKLIGDVLERETDTFSREVASGLAVPRLTGQRDPTTARGVGSATAGWNTYVGGKPILVFKQCLDHLKDPLAEEERANLVSGLPFLIFFFFFFF
jgi:hypothetical protein